MDLYREGMLLSEYCFGDDCENKDSCGGGPWLCQDLVMLLVSFSGGSVFSLSHF